MLLEEGNGISEEYITGDKDEFEKILALGRKMTTSVPCTSCRYCTEYCPQGLDIPELISLYNEQVFSGGGFIVGMRLSNMDKDKKPGQRKRAGLLITHLGYILNFVKADKAHVLMHGIIACSGDPDEILEDIRKEGFKGCVGCAECHS